MSEVVVTLHQNAANPVESKASKIVEAYGLRKCPKLVEQCQAEDIVVRVNALTVLCEEFRNPSSIRECCKANSIDVLSKLILDADYMCRFRSSQALAIAAEDANGFASMLDKQVIPTILKGIHDSATEVRSNVFECMYQCSRIANGIDAIVKAGGVGMFVKSVVTETDLLKIPLLKALYNCVKTEDGLNNALDAKAVSVCVDLLANGTEEVAAEACRTLGFLCYCEEAKDQALECGAIPKLIDLLKSRSKPLRLSCSIALMAITSTDEGKRQMTGNGAAVAALLIDPDLAVKMNALKVIANIAVNPKVRKELLDHDTCESSIAKMVASGDKILIKHAQIALDSVKWKA